jgi:hypothetical protein
MTEGIQFEHPKQLQPTQLLCNEAEKHQPVVFLRE